MKSTATGAVAAALILVAFTPATAAARTWTVCPVGTKDKACRFRGDGAIQAAVDAAADGDLILLRKGVYRPRATRDVRYKEITARGYVLVQGKRLALRGEPGVVLDGARGKPASAMVVDHGDVELSHLAIRGFRYQVEEDDIYDGHGLFLIDSRARVRDVSIDRVAKMAVTLRGASIADIEGLTIRDGHVGVWLEESSQLRLGDCLIRNGESAALAAYGHSSAVVRNCVVEGNRDDGIYAAGSATATVANSIILRNAPFGVRGVDDSRILVDHSVLFANEADFSSTTNKDQLRIGPAILKVDPKLTPEGRLPNESPLARQGDPDFGKGVGLAPAPEPAKARR